MRLTISGLFSRNVFLYLPLWMCFVHISLFCIIPIYFYHLSCLFMSLSSLCVCLCLPISLFSTYIPTSPCFYTSLLSISTYVLSLYCLIYIYKNVCMAIYLVFMSMYVRNIKARLAFRFAKRLELLEQLFWPHFRSKYFVPYIVVVVAVILKFNFLIRDFPFNVLWKTLKRNSASPSHPNFKFFLNKPNWKPLLDRYLPIYSIALLRGCREV